MHQRTRTLIAGLLIGLPLVSSAQTGPLLARMDKTADGLTAKVIAWRRDFHQHPELGNREVETAAKIAAHLKSLGIDVKTGVAKTGVVGILKGGKPGPVVALRADMDALPVVERGDLPFKSTVKTEFGGQPTGVMHACGHDSHMAILMATAEVLASVRSELKGTVKFIFQPAEEGPPAGEEGGARLMVKEGVLDNPKVDAIFGLHIKSEIDVNTLKYRSGSLMAAADRFTINVTGKSTHGGNPWLGVDPIVTASQLVMGLQTIVSRNLPLTEAGAVVSVGAFNGGSRFNIIPEEVNMAGTIRSFSPAMQKTIHDRINQIATNIAESAGAKATVKIDLLAALTYNDPALTAQMVPTLERMAGKDRVTITPATTISEDFSFYQEKVPGFFFFLGGKPLNVKPEDAPPHHTPDFFIDESGFGLGVKALSHLAVEYLEQKAGVAGR